MSQDVLERLNRQLADFQVHYQRLRNYHWNVRGPRFFELHAKFEELYTEAALHVDAIAERILQLGGHPYSTLIEQLDNARLREDAPRTIPDAAAMLRTIVQDQEAMVRHLREDAGLAGGEQDTATMNLLDGIADGKEKVMWMLRAAV